MSPLPQSVHDNINNIRNRFPSWDAVMAFDVFLFFLSFWILATEKDVDFVFGARAWLWYFNAFFIMDLFFRLLSLKIESIKRENWNHIIPCIFTLSFWMLAAYYDFESVFGSKPVQGFNIFIFLVYHIGLVLYIFQSFFNSLLTSSSQPSNPSPPPSMPVSSQPTNPPTFIIEEKV